VLVRLESDLSNACNSSFSKLDRNTGWSSCNRCCAGAQVVVSTLQQLLSASTVLLIHSVFMMNLQKMSQSEMTKQTSQTGHQVAAGKAQQ